MEWLNLEPTCLGEGSQLSTGLQTGMPSGARQTSRQGGSLAWSAGSRAHRSSLRAPPLTSSCQWACRMSAQGCPLQRCQTPSL